MQNWHKSHNIKEGIHWTHRSCSEDRKWLSGYGSFCKFTFGQIYRWTKLKLLLLTTINEPSTRVRGVTKQICLGPKHRHVAAHWTKNNPLLGIKKTQQHRKPSILGKIRYQIESLTLSRGGFTVGCPEPELKFSFQEGPPCRWSWCKKIQLLGTHWQPPQISWWTDQWQVRGHCWSLGSGAL